MEYNAMDQKQKAEHFKSQEIDDNEGDNDNEGINFKLLGETDVRDTPLDDKGDKGDAWDLKNLGLQAAQRILQSSTPLATLEYISQNLPSLLNSLVKVRVNESIRGEIGDNQKFYQPGSNALIVNGRVFDLEKFTPFSLIDAIHYETTLSKKLQTSGIQKEDVNKVLSTPQKFDQSQRFQLNEEIINWMNDLTKDDMYFRLSPNLEDIQHQGWYGPNWVRHNIFNMIIACDPSTKDCLDAARDTWGMWRQGYPMRFGYVFASLEEEKEITSMSVGFSGEQIPVTRKVQSIGSKVMSVFHYIREKRNTQESINFLVRCNHGVKTNKILSEDVLRSEFMHAPQDLSYDNVIDQYSHFGEKSTRDIVSKGFTDLPFISFNGKISKNLNPQALNNELNYEYPLVVDLVLKKVLLNGMNPMETMNNHYQSSQFYHPSIFGSFNYKEIPIHPFRWIQFDDNSKSISHIVCVKDDKDALKTIKNGLLSLQLKSGVRLAVLSSDRRVRPFFNELLVDLASKSIESSLGRIETLLSTEESEKSENLVDRSLDTEFCRRMSNSQNIIITNGKLVDFKAVLEKRDFDSMERLEKSRMGPIIEKFAEYPSPRSDLIMHVASIMGIDIVTKGKRSPIYLEQLKKDLSVVRIRENDPTIPVIAIVNPLSVVAQKISTLLSILDSHFSFAMTIYMNPMLAVSDVPLKTWYRYVLKPELEFKNGDIVHPSALFKHLPPQNVLTLNMDVQETWLVGLTYSIYDLDNIKVSDIDHTLYARYQLDSIVVSGSCVNIKTGKPPRGLQLVDKVTDEDTLVMASFGYFQIKANPNIVKISIAPGRHSDIYEIVEYSVTRFNDPKSDIMTPSNGNSTIIHLTSFDGPNMQLRVKKRPGQGKAVLLADSNGSFMSSLSNMFQSDQEEMVHIFSVASGHMYERLLKIMILSVIKHTKGKVKFWFLKNYLSPQFKEYLPLMAKRYGFEFGLVMYKWPIWLNKQTVKMRTIWAYKVLFLDVLFPLKVNKIIFVDADQICRTDMNDLVKTNLNGAVIGMTPFCSDKPEMDGYRFWAQGYWSNHLRGKPYHISALYVVDILKLRKDYAGDQYRMLYDSLSKDPNSLSNLDQDLPNYAQHQIRIHSLSQEWLWCEAWCGDGSKSKARTIDLCNNPDTKENKLDSARRIVPEWNDYDAEQEKFGREMKEEGLLKFPL